MTADTKLLPLPEGVDVIFSPDGNGAALDVFIAEQVQDYARANVAHATEPLKAEIERLRAEREVIGAEAVKYAGKSGRLEAKVDRLAEALLELCNVIDGHEVPVAVEGKAAHARAALRDHDQEEGK